MPATTPPPPRRNKKPLAIVLILLGLLGSAGAWWWNSQRVKTGGSAEPPAGAGAQARTPAQTVGVYQVQRRDVPVQVEASGTVAALQSVDIRAQTSSLVREVLIKDGDSVRKGQLLFRFDDRADRANVERARAQLARDRASLADAERQYQRAQELRAQNFIAPSALDSSLAAVEAQRAAVQADLAALQSAELSLGYNELRAPMAGRAGAISVHPGSLVQGGSASALPLVSLAQIDPIGVSFNLPETQLAALLAATRSQPGQQGAPAALQAQLLRPGAQGAATGAGAGPETEALRGRLDFVDNLVDASTGTIKVRAAFDNERQSLWPGQYVRIRMTLSTLKDALVLPQAALILRGNERSVYRVDSEGRAQLRTVQLRYSFGEMAVVEGLEAGDTVVVDGKQNLRPGTPVKPQAARAQEARAKPEAGTAKPEAGTAKPEAGKTQAERAR